MADEATAAAPAAPVSDAAPAAEPAADSAPAAPADSGGQPAPADSTAAAEPVSVDKPSLLSSAEGKTPQTEPAPGADATEATPAAKQAAKDQGGDDKGATDPAHKDATPTDPKKDQAPAPLSITDLTLPEGVTPEAEGSARFMELMNNRELAAKDRAQGLIDLHRAEIERVHREVTDNQRRVWDDLNAGWRDQLRKDAEIGGNRLHTNLSKAKGMIEEHLSPDDATALLRHVDINGMGNFPPFIRLLVKLADRLNVFEDGIVMSNPAPSRPARTPGNRGWYDKT
ncbi:MAG: hypothetical protein J2P16_10585 [Mycobacterium sp.]|nr:hypothetical protein [Mycobacterium sp.]